VKRPTSEADLRSQLLLARLPFSPKRATQKDKSPKITPGIRESYGLNSWSLEIPSQAIRKHWTTFQRLFPLHPLGRSERQEPFIRFGDITSQVDS
jgi:hypothetical protein